MTTRLHAPWRRTAADGSELETWHELVCLLVCFLLLEHANDVIQGRPQIHGYPIASVTFTDRLQFISGADEKIVRVFDAPKVFLTSLNKLSLISGLGDEVSRPYNLC